VTYVGEVGGQAKRDLCARARTLVFPIQWDEPFGMVMIEAMACGTPVVASRCGSVPEVVTPGRTGFIADTVDGLVDAVTRVHEIDRAECRRHAERRFSVARMADGYEAVYERLCAPARAA
jgi:glycosyltransferase involved in cell wall biosynthesis